MINVICVNWGTKYPIEYTQRLYNMVERNLTVPFKFYCLTDNIVLYDKLPHINTIEYDGDDNTWWVKLNLFKPGVLEEKKWIYFDLDVIIVDNIDSLVEHEGFGISRDFIRPDNGLLTGKEYNSSVLSFNLKDCYNIWEYYKQNYKLWHDYQKQIHFFGDQNVISAYINYTPGFVNPFPDEWLWSYKKGVKRGEHAGDRSRYFGREIPSQGKICVFHGHPNPTEVNDEWVKKHYR